MQTPCCSMSCVDVIHHNDKGTVPSVCSEKSSVLASAWVVWGSPQGIIGQQLNQMQPSPTIRNLSWLQEIGSSDSVSPFTKSLH